MYVSDKSAALEFFTSFMRVYHDTTLTFMISLCVSSDEDDEDMGSDDEAYVEEDEREHAGEGGTLALRFYF